MSHEDLASLWSILHQVQDVTIPITAAAGHHALVSVLPQDGSGSHLHSLLVFAIEITAIFDFIQASRRAKPETVDVNRDEKDQRCICSALVYLLRRVQSSLALEDLQAAKSSIQICVRAILSAICALNAISPTQQPIEAEHVAAASYELASQLSKDEGEFVALQALCYYLNTHFRCEKVRQQVDSATTMIDTIFDADSDNVSELIGKLVDRATEANTDCTDRVDAIIEICYVYWTSEAFLIGNCLTPGAKDAEQTLTEDVESGIAAMFARSIIQENFICANLERPSDPWAKSFGPAILFTPGLSHFCTLDACSCPFNDRMASSIFDLRKQRSRLLQSQLPKFQGHSSLNQTAFDDIDTVFVGLTRRLDCLSNGKSSSSAVAVGRVNNASSMPRKPVLQRNTSPKSSTATVEKHSPELEPRPSLQRASRRRHTQPHIYSTRNTAFAVIDETIESSFHNASPEPEAVTGQPERADSGKQGSDRQSQTDTSTILTSSSSSRRGSDSMVISPNSTHSFLNLSDSDKIVVEVPQSPTIHSPMSLEKNYPEVAIRAAEPDALSITSDHSIPQTVYTVKNPTSRSSKFGGLFKSKKDPVSTFALPKFRFFASGKHLILWTKYGAGIIDPSQLPGRDFTPVHDPDVVHAAGGTNKYVIISRYSQTYKMSIYHLGSTEKLFSWELQKNPPAIDISRNDRYLALKYTRAVLLYDLEQPSAVINHKLNSHDINSQPGVGNHLVSFAHDSMSFMAATRYQPERVYIYWNQCVQSLNARGLYACSTAPCGHVEDHGLTGLTVCGPTQRSYPNGFLSTFTEKGYPVTVNMHPQGPTARLLRDQKEQIGTRIHGSAMSIEPSNSKANLAVINQSNQVYWITDLFGHDMETHKLATLKRPKSLRSEVQIAMSEVDEASVFWVDKNLKKGVLVRVGRKGGVTAPSYFRLDVDPLCGG